VLTHFAVLVDNTFRSQRALEWERLDPFIARLRTTTVLGVDE
jgi:hypothetical protein